MSFSVVTNISALNSQAQLDKTNMGLQTTLARLTSGLRINSSADDAAGLAVCKTGTGSDIVLVDAGGRRLRTRPLGSAVVIEAGTSLEIRVGESRIMITEKGDIVLTGNNLLSRARRVNKIRGAAVNIN